MTDAMEAATRALCEADDTAPDPDAPIYIKMRAAKAWEARLPSVTAAVIAFLGKRATQLIEQGDLRYAAALLFEADRLERGNG